MFIYFKNGGSKFYSSVTERFQRDTRPVWKIIILPLKMCKFEKNTHKKLKI